MKNFLADFFYFNKRERKGIYFLILIIILIASSNLVMPLLIKRPGVDFDKYNKIISEYDKLLISSESSQDSTAQLFRFDPNELNLEGWLKLGLNSKQAQVILNYRDKGGTFKKKEDLKKIYSIDDELFVKLEPFIFIINNSNQTKQTLAKTINLNELQIELNSTDSTQLIKIKGIGPVFASRIIKYRNLLGGYFSISQLQEVYGLDSLKYESIKENFIPCNSELIQRININEADFSQLLKHPYISYDFTKYIVNQRKKEVFDSVEDAFNIQFISDSVFKKLLPYLTTK